MTLLQSAMSLGIVGIIAKGTLLLAIGWCGTLLLRRAPAVARHLVWLTVIVGVLLIPVLARVAPMNVPVLPSVVITSGTAPARDVASDNLRARSTAASVAQPSIEATQSPSNNRRTWLPDYGVLAAILWLVVAALLVVRLFIGMLSVGRIIRRGRSLHSAEWTRALDDAVARLKLASPPRLVMSDQVEMAFAFDAFAPTIIVPVSAEEWTHDRRRAVLLHELAHIRRRDLIGHTIASIACAVYWFNPFVWLAARRLRVESELASDDVVLESGVRPSDYAQHLLDLVTNVGQHAPTFALAMARPKEFEGRLVAILDRANRRWVIGKTQRGTMVGVLGLLTVCIAAAVPVPRGRTVAPVVASEPSLPLRDSAMTVRVEPLPIAPRVNHAAPPTVAAPMLSDVAISTLLRFGTGAIVNPMMMILRDADSLGLSGRQADSIATLNRWYMVRLNAIWSPVSGYYVNHSLEADANSTTDAFRRAPQASMDLLIGLAPNITGLLTVDQRSKLRPQIAAYLDAQNLTDIAAGRAGAPGGVFNPNGGQFGGGRRGGRGGI